MLFIILVYFILVIEILLTLCYNDVIRMSRLSFTKIKFTLRFCRILYLFDVLRNSKDHLYNYQFHHFFENLIYRYL